MPLAETLIDGKPEAVAAYLGYFWRRGSGGKDALSPSEFADLVAAYARPGAFTASIAYYRARAGDRAREADMPPGPPIVQPATVLWSDADPFLPVTWADCLGEYFADVQLTVLPGTGHFVPVEAPDAVAEAIAAAAFHEV